MKKLLIFLFLLASPISVFADGFSERGDNSQNSFYHTIAYTVERDSMPVSSELENSIQYMDLDVVGEDSESFANNQNIYTLTGAYHMIRSNNIGTHVAVPPLSRINVGYYYFNGSGHSVNIPKIKVTYSRGLNGNNGVSFIKNNSRLSRLSPFVEYAGIGEVRNGEEGKKLLDTLYVDNPLSFPTIETSEGEEGINIVVVIKNSSNEDLKNLQFYHRGYMATLDIAPNSEYRLNYSVTLPETNSSDTDLGYFTLFNPNVLRECSVFGTAYNEWFNIESVSVFSYRDDGGWAHGSYVQPDEESFCIERIPYSMTSPRIHFEKNGEEEVVQEEIGEDKESVVLGSVDIAKENFVLPKTALFDPFVGICAVVLLVVDIFLWYSVLRRRRYEKKNIFTKLRTKGCKNSLERGL